jgi:hypothetical protein
MKALELQLFRETSGSLPHILFVVNRQLANLGRWTTFVQCCHLAVVPGYQAARENISPRGRLEYYVGYSAADIFDRMGIRSRSSTRASEGVCAAEGSLASQEIETNFRSRSMGYFWRQEMLYDGGQ